MGTFKSNSVPTPVLFLFDPGHVCVLSRLQVFATPWTIAHQAPLSMEFSRQEYWSGSLFPIPGDLPNPGIEPKSPALAGGFFTISAPWEAPGRSSQRVDKTGAWGLCQARFESLLSHFPAVWFQASERKPLWASIVSSALRWGRGLGSPRNQPLRWS